MALKTSTGMLREWTFSATLEHQAARCRIRLLPQWISINIDADEVAHQPDPLRPFSAVKPFYGFQDFSAPPKAGDMWEEVVKEVLFFRCRLAAGATLTDWCKRCIQFVLADERTQSVDGEKRLNRITIGTKLSSCTHVLGGLRCFSFTFKRHDKTATIADSHHVAYGTIVNGTAYFVQCSCTKEPELRAYFTDSLVPHLSDPGRFTPDIEVTYPATANETLQQQQELFGVFRYFDRGAAIEFSLPMHPMQMRPDHSPLQSAGFGSLTCLTLDLDVYHKLYDSEEASTQGFATGMPRYKANSIVLYIEVEDVMKLGFPSVMSVDQYATLKTKKLLETFRDARVVGAPLSLQLGHRVGRATTCTFSSEMDGPSAGRGTMPNRQQQQRGVPVSVKALIVSTLVGSHGASAVFFTKLGQALFDTHVYIFHHLMKTLRFFMERELVGTFTREEASRVRLTDQDLPRAYSAATDKTGLVRHLSAIQASTDGEVEDAHIIVVPSDGALGDDSEPPKAEVSFGRFAEDSTLDNAVPEPRESDSVVSVKDIAHLADLEMFDEAEVNAESVTAPSPEVNGEKQEVGAVESPSPDGLLPPGKETPSVVDVDERQSPEQHLVDQQDGGRNTGVVSPADDVDPKLAGVIKDALSIKSSIDTEDILAARGQALRGIYRSCCEAEGAKPNSYLLQKLPDQARFTETIEELDMSFNYVGHAGFRAIVRLLASMPHLHTVHFNSMALDNSDVEALCSGLASNETVRSVHLRQNPRVTLPSAHHLLKLLRSNPNITTLSMSGCDIGASLLRSVEQKALENARRRLLDDQNTAHGQPSPVEPITVG